MKREELVSINVEGLRKIASKAGIKNSKQYKRDQLLDIIVEKTEPKVEEQKAKATRKRKVSNFQMIPAIKENINDEASLIKLYNENAEVFKSSVKYLPDNMKVIGQAIVNKFDPNFTVKMGKKIALTMEQEAV